MCIDKLQKNPCVIFILTMLGLTIIPIVVDPINPDWEEEDFSVTYLDQIKTILQTYISADVATEDEIKEPWLIQGTSSNKILVCYDLDSVDGWKKTKGFLLKYCASSTDNLDTLQTAIENLDTKGIYVDKYNQSYEIILKDNTWSSWTDESTGSAEISVTASLDGHTYVLYLNDTAAATEKAVGQLILSREINIPHLTFYMRKGATYSKSVDLEFYDSSSNKFVSFYFSSTPNAIAVVSAAGSVILETPAAAETWFKIDIYFDWTNQTFVIYLDDVRIETTFDFITTGTGLYKIIATSSTSAESDWYIDFENIDPFDSTYPLTLRVFNTNDMSYKNRIYRETNIEGTWI